MIPCLYITYNRIDYTKQTLPELINSDCDKIIIIDNHSTDGTAEYLEEIDHPKIQVIFKEENTGIAGAMNIFLQLTKGYEFVSKIDNDTIVPKNWCNELLRKLIACDLDILQAKHNLDPAVTKGLTFDEWMRTMRQDEKDKSVYYHHFVGGSGIVFRRNKIDILPETEWLLYSWRQYQREHPELRTAFTTDVKVKLLDGGGDYSKYPNYYIETKRLIC